MGCRTCRSFLVKPTREAATGSLCRLHPKAGWGLKLHNLGPGTATVVLRMVDVAGITVSRAIKLAPLSLTPIRLVDLPDRPVTAFILQVESDEPVFGLSRDWQP